MINKLLLLISLVPVFVFSQDDEYQYKYESPSFYDSINNFLNTCNEDFAILKSEEYYENRFVGENLFVFFTTHNLEVVNSDNEIESNNKIYLPYGENSEILNPMARIVSPSGVIKELDESEILDSKDEETNRNYHYFALEGLEKGSLIEYWYTTKKYPTLNGARNFLQFNYPIYNYYCKFVVPDHLVFEFKVYNDTNNFIFDTLDTINNCWSLRLDTIEELENEESCPYNDLRKKFVYKFDRNLSTGAKDLSSYGIASKNVYNMTFADLTKNEIKAMDKFLKKNKIADITDNREKIYEIENYIKSNIKVSDYSSNELSDISSILSNNVASHSGITRLYVNLLKKLEFTPEVILTTDNTDEAFDSKFEAFNYLQEYLIYIKEIDDYITPTEFEYRLGLIPFIVSGNEGLFIREKKIGNFVTGIGEVKEIPTEPYEKSDHHIEIEATIPDDLSNVKIDMTNRLSGYFAVYYQPYWELLNEESRNDMVEDEVENSFKNAEILDWKVENGESKDLYKEPFILNANIVVDNLLEEAGDKVLFNLGMLIGPQKELYSEHERTLPVFDNFKRRFTRNLTINIPEGYVIKNPDDIIIESFDLLGSDTVLLFKSEYTLENNVLNVKIDEYYDRIYHTVEQYEKYREVVNSAADFNKVVLVLEKK